MSNGKRSLVLLLAVAIFWILFPPTGKAAKKKPYGPYRAMVVRVIDGDTVEVDVLPWPGLVQRVKLRLAGVNTPEKRGRGVSLCEKVAAKRATDFTRRFVRHVAQVTVSEVRLGKFAGRVLGKISVNGRDLGDAPVAAGLGRPYSGGRRRAWC
ncbi:MAG: thermonuclease family protein [bacterium]